MKKIFYFFNFILFAFLIISCSTNKTLDTQKFVPTQSCAPTRSNAPIPSQPTNSSQVELIPGAGTVARSSELKNKLENDSNIIEVSMIFEDFSDEIYHDNHLSSCLYEGKTIAEWKSIWQNSLDIDDEKKYYEAVDYIANSKDFIEWYLNFESVFEKESKEKEIDRLSPLGYFFTFDKKAGCYTGVFLKEQLLAFPASEYIGYYLDVYP